MRPFFIIGIFCRLIVTGYRKTLEPSDLPALNPHNTTGWNYPKFNLIWSQVLAQWRANTPAAVADASKPPQQDASKKATAEATDDREAKVKGGGEQSKPLLAGDLDAPKATTENPKLGQSGEKPSADEKKRAAKAKQKQEDADLKRYPSLFLVLLCVFWRTLLKAHLCKLLQDLIQYLNPVWLGYCIVIHNLIMC